MNLNQDDNLQTQYLTNPEKIFKVKYKLDKFNPKIDNTYELFSYIYEHTFNCEYDYLVYKFGKPDSNNKWIIKIKASDSNVYYLIINRIETNCTLIENTTWTIGGQNPDLINYDKIIKLIEFENCSYLKKKRKENKLLEKKLEKLKSNNNFVNNINFSFNSKLIDEDKYNKMNLELLKYSDDDLASVLFVRFKKSGNYLLKDALKIHRNLNNSNGQINKSEQINDSNIENKLNNIKNKTKYNNKR